MITSCEMQFKDGVAQIIFRKNLDFVMGDNEGPNVYFKGFMADVA